MSSYSKVSRDTLLAIIAKLYTLLNDYISGSGSTNETDAFMAKIKDMLEREGFVSRSQK